MISAIQQWIAELLIHYKDQRIRCSSLPNTVTCFFPEEFLQHAYFVATQDIPKPTIAADIPGAADFLALPAQGITYQNTYFLHPNASISTHIHELVHVAQWKLLGPQGFIQSYIQGVQDYGYRDSPLEKMAYTIQGEFESACSAFDIVARVKQELALE